MLHLCQDAQKQGGNQDFFVGRAEAMTLRVSAVHTAVLVNVNLGVHRHSPCWLHGAAASPPRSRSRGAEARRPPPTACAGCRGCTAPGKTLPSTQGSETELGRHGKWGTWTQTFQGSSSGGWGGCVCRKGSALLV